MTIAIVIATGLLHNSIVLWPPQRYWVKAESIPVIIWVGQGPHAANPPQAERGGDERSGVSLNGSPIPGKYLKVGGAYKRYLHGRVPLRPGRNTLSVGAPAAGSPTISLFRHDPLYPLGSGQGFSRSTFHTSKNERRCQPCHFGTKKTYCTDCHREAKKPYLHGPVASGKCTLCHRPAPRASLARFTPISSPSGLCLSCHQHTVHHILWRKYGHGPASSFQCTLCHEPHSSRYPFTLKKNTNALCATCHPEKKGGRHVLAGYVYGDSHPMSGWDDPIEEGRQFTCASCHDPHASHSPDMQKFGERDRFSFCQRCHNK